MRTVYKYEFNIELDGKFDLHLPDNHQILKVGVQGPNPCMWVLVETNDETFPIGFTIYGTGHEIKSYLHFYVGTFCQHPLVWHVFKNVDTTD